MLKQVSLGRPSALLFGVVFVAALAIAAFVPASGRAVVNIEGVTPQALPNYDSRASAAPTADALAAAQSLGADVTWNRFGVASSVSNEGHFVTTGLQAPNAVSAARAWIADHKALFGLDSTDSLAAETTQPLIGTNDDYAITFRQYVDGVPSTDGIATVALVGSKDAGWKVTYASSSLAGGSTDPTGFVQLDPAEAWTAAADQVGVGTSVANVTSESTRHGLTTLSVDGLSQTQDVQKSVFTTPYNGAKEAYTADVTNDDDGNLQSYQVVVDANTGDVLYRQNQVDNLTDNPTWKAPRHSMPFNPMNAYPWNYPATDGRSVFCWTATAGCDVVASDDPATNMYPGGVASKYPWDVQLDVTGTNLGTTATVGNNVDDARVWSGSHGAYGNPALLRDTSATRDYQPAFTDAWYTSGCDPAQLTGNGNDIEASTVSLFVGHNVMHDWAYYLGFDEGHWNAQQYNNGVTVNDPSPPPGGPTIAAPLGNDGLLGNAQSGALTGSRDNANMSTGADGAHPTTNQFLWQPLAGSFYAPCVDGAFDFSVFGHEYGHLIENRMIGKGVGARQGNAAGAMGEAFGDFDALAAFNELHLPVPTGANKYTEGAYATGNPYNGIRDFLAGEPMGGEFPQPSQNPHTDPLNYGDFGFDIVGPEVHADGEIWVAAQIGLRELFLTNAKSHGFPVPTDALDISCARGQTAAVNCPGDRRWIQDYYDAMVLMPRGPTMIQARDAMLAADLARYTADPAWGNNQDLLWQGFAMYGFGNTQNTVSNADTDPVPAFDAPAGSGINNATINFFADSKDGSAVPVNAKIYVGDYSARATPIADTDPSTVNGGTNATSNLDNVVPIVPNGAGSLAGGTTEANNRWQYYNFVAVAPGYGITRFRVKNLKPGEVRNITLHLPTNYASATQGATVATDAPATGTNLTPGNLIDDNEATTNTQSCTPTATCLVPVNGRWVVIKLGNVPPAGIEINRLGVSAMFSSRFVGLRSFDAYACKAGKVAANPTCDGSIDAGWTKIITGASDSFPGANPRPGTQDESLRYFNASPQPLATHLKFVVTNNQCTGQPSFHGDQDLDPNNNAECRTGIRQSEVHTAEIEVFATKPTADGTLVSTG